MRTASTVVLAFAAALFLASAAQAAPTAAAPGIPVLADHSGVGVGVGVGVGPRRPYGYRFVGGYYQTVYQWVWVPGALARVDAFGRAVHLPGHWEQQPFRVWVPYSVVYARPYTRSVTGGVHLGTGFRGW